MQTSRSPQGIIGIDVGGTKIAASLVDAQGSILWSARRPTDLSGPDATLDSIAAAVKDLIAANGIEPRSIEAIGFGIPGLVDAENGIGIASVNLGWKNVAVRAGLEARLGVRCAIDNDVRTGALGELHFGAARGLKNLVYLNVGTGISAVIWFDGKFYLGSRGLAGEIGHAVVKPNGPACRCGGRGCLEATASGPGIAERALCKVKNGQHSILVPREAGLSRPLTAEEVFAAAAQGDRVAVETLEEIAELMAHVLQYLCLAYDPEAIVIGGGVVLSCPLLFKCIKQTLQELASSSWVFGKAYAEDLVRLSSLGNNAGCLALRPSWPLQHKENDASRMWNPGRRSPSDT